MPEDICIPGEGRFRADRTDEALINGETLRALRRPEPKRQFTCTPPGSGLRIGINRDEDGLLDGDEEIANVTTTGPRDVRTRETLGVQPHLRNHGSYGGDPGPKLLDAGRISRGKIDLRRERAELSSVVYHVVEAARPISERRDQELTVTLPRVPVYVDADPTRLGQIIGNLLNNACKFTERGGHIWLTVECEDDSNADRGAAEATRVAPQVVVRVRDTGIGIAADQLERVFDMFTQVDTSLERSLTGLGIGLTLVRTLTEMHGGSVEVSSDGANHGSEFVVRLPIAMEAQTPESTFKGGQSGATTPRRILIVDDNHDSAEMLATLLELAGHETFAAHDGLAAVEAAAKLDLDVILLDIGLPVMNGYEAARRIREQRGQKRRPLLVALTGWGQDEDRGRSEEAGFDAHLVKPVDEAVLDRLLTDLTVGTQEIPG